MCLNQLYTQPNAYGKEMARGWSTMVYSTSCQWSIVPPLNHRTFGLTISYYRRHSLHNFIYKLLISKCLDDSEGHVFIEVSSYNAHQPYPSARSLLLSHNKEIASSPWQSEGKGDSYTWLTRLRGIKERKLMQWGSPNHTQRYKYPSNH